MRRLALLVLLLIAAGLPFGVSSYVLGVLTLAYYFGVFAMSWDLLFGFAGEVNFGPTFLIGLGAYAAGLLDNHGWPVWLDVIAGALAALRALDALGEGIEGLVVREPTLDDVFLALTQARSGEGVGA